jgi:hypothetical protein
LSVVWVVASAGSEPPVVAPILEEPVRATGAPSIAVERAVEPARVWRRGPFASVQVNVDANGDNILSDAANEPSIAIDPTDPDKIVIGWRQFDTFTNSFRTSGYAYSHDGGQTWTFPGVLEPGEFSSDPVLDYDQDGNIYYNGLQPNRGPGEWACYIYKSSDGGVTWPQEVYAYGGDKQWMSIDRSGGIGMGNIYMHWSPFAGCCGSNLFTRSTDGGLTFMPPVPLPQNPFFGTQTVGPDGELYIVGGINYPVGPFVVLKSTNAQDPLSTPTFGQDVNVSLGGFLVLSAGPNPEGLLGQVQVETNHADGPNRGDVYVLASVNPSGSDPLDVMFARSTDGGLTWSAPVRVNDDPAGTDAWQWFGTMSVAPNGRIDVIFNDTRNSGAVNLSELHYAFSTDGGLTWSQNIAVSPEFDSFLGWPQQNKLGDYYDMISDNEGASIAWAATFNGEQDVYFLRIEGDCNNNGVPDATDIDEGTSDDCNENGVPDECESPEDCNENGVQDICDVADGTSEDVNGNGIPDECECTTETVLPPATAGALKNRYLSVIGSNPGLQTAVRVTPTSALAGFEIIEGKHFWLSVPRDVSEVPSANDDTPPVFTGANLQCTPHYMDWSTVGLVQVFDDEIIPATTYEIQTVIDGCSIDFEPNFSDALVLQTTPVWGDVVGDFSGSEWTAPDGVTDFLDIASIVESFKGEPASPVKARSDIAEEGPDAIIDFLDISACVEAFKGESYPFAIPTDCP